MGQTPQHEATISKTDEEQVASTLKDTGIDKDSLNRTASLSEANS